MNSTSGFNLTQAQVLYNNNECSPGKCPPEYASILYTPSFGGNLYYVIFFISILIAQTVLAWRYRIWGFYLGMLGGLILEITGYIGRVLLHQNVFNQSYFICYIVCITMGPAFFSGSIYFCLSHIIRLYGNKLSQFSPRVISAIFICCDVVCLALQATGGGLSTSTADASQAKLAINILLAGVSCQVVSLTLFIGVCVDFAWRVYKAPSISYEYKHIITSRRFHFFLYALTTATFAILIRSCYRVAELSEGFYSALANNQATFMILEGGMIAIACLALTLCHPGWGFQGTWKQTKAIHSEKKGDKKHWWQRVADRSDESVDIIKMEAGVVPKKRSKLRLFS